MSFETARKAVTAFINHRPKRAGIGFYGGEPLLEFDLLKQIVLFAEEQAGQFATSVGFSITTNGTLLTDEKIHFLAQHEFSVLVSLDGDKKSHDRYRIFRNQNRPEKRIGSFDTVIKNMTRFVELYPEYLGRGIAVTLTATSDFQAIEQFVSKWEPSYPTIMANFVQAVPDDPRAGCGDRCIQLGRLRTVPCANGSCGRERLPEVDEDNYCAASVGLLGGNDGPAETPAFCNWTRDSVHRLQSNHDCFMASVRCVKDSSDANVLRSKFPLGCSQLDRSFRSVHFRQVSGNRNSEQYVFRLSCFPGATRTYCSSQGFLFSCERTEWGSLLELGSAANDFDVDVRKAHELTELVRLLCDCGNCVANRLCSHCPALVSESREHPGTVDGLAFQEECRQTQAALPGKLKAYTELMEVNPEILDVLLSGTTVDDDWLNDVKVIVPRRKAVEELVAEEIEEIV
jgi:sulfatase maturation enzyme AslB (radical SAM superfamily)